jgi:hypothetical protein
MPSSEAVKQTQQPFPSAATASRAGPRYLRLSTIEGLSGQRRSHRVCEYVVEMGRNIDLCHPSLDRPYQLLIRHAR